MIGRSGSRVVAPLLWVIVLSLSMCPAIQAGEIVGWRMDGTGNYTGSNPPDAIGPEQNVAWKTPMPDWSNASPILVEGRLYVCSEPYDILCVDAGDGKILWRKSNAYTDLASPGPDLSRRIRQEVARDSILLRQEKAIGKEHSKLRKQAKADTGNSELKAQIKAKGKEISEVKAKREALQFAGKVRDWPTHRTNGYTSRTLVSDGKHVYGSLGNGMVVCYDLDGNLKWYVQHKPTFHVWGESSSPVLAHDKVIVHYGEHYVAHRVSDGKELWRYKVARAYGTPIVTDVGGTAILVTAQGHLLDVKTGKALIDPVFKPLNYAAPLVENGVIYALGRADSLCVALQLPTSVAALRKDGVKELWTRGLKRDRYYGSPVLHEGLLYAFTRNHTLTVLDAKTGETAYTTRVKGLKGHGYMSPTVAGGRVYLNGEKGSMVTLQTGREYVEATPVQFGPFRSNPIFTGKRMYLRTYEYLYCFE
jgi:outer membrane protein assembly factor BamB